MRGFLAGIAVLTLAALGSLSAAAEGPALAWPVDCRLGEDCWLVHHVDMDPGPGAADFRCGALTYNEHKGTDIALRDRAAMFRPYAVRAAAAGVVAGMRDNAPDHPGDEAGIREAMEKGEECGNGVLIRHDDGWSTQYCHLKSGSVRVAPGQRVAAGALLGHAGNSGAAGFPHLHFTVRRGETVVDPFTGLAMGQGCGAAPKAPLWSAAVQAFLPGEDAPMLPGVGFRASAPRYDALLQDMSSPETLAVEGPGLVLWAVGYGLRAGDVLAFEITGPDGATFTAQRFTQEKTQIRAMRFAGRSNRNGILAPGVYRGRVQVIRQREAAPPLTIERTATVTLER